MQRSQAVPSSSSSSLVPPSSFRALVARTSGPSFRQVAYIKEIPTPKLAATEVLIRVDYAGVNGGCETFRARGEHAFKGNAGATDFALGAEGVGTVVAAGPRVKSLHPGDAVSFVGGAFAEYVVARALTCTPIPAASPEYAALTISGTTAVSALEAVGGIRTEDVVLVTAAAGGTGHFAVQLAKSHGCHVVATCGGSGKAEVVRGLGADRVIDHTVEDPQEVLSREYPSLITLCFEGVGGRMRDAALASLHPRGRLLNVGYISEYPHTQDGADAGPGAEGAARGGAAGAACAPSSSTSPQSSSELHSERGNTEADSAAPLPHASVLFWSPRTVKRGDQVIYGSVWPEDRGAVAGLRSRAFQLYQEGALRVVIDPRCREGEFVGVEGVVGAVEHMLSGRSVGKVVVGMQGLM